MRLVWILSLAACGRFDFGAHADAADDGSTNPIDAPALPTLVCNATRLSIPAVVADTQLAAFHSADGYYAMWAKDGPVSGLALDAQLAPRPVTTVIATTAAGVAGLVDTGEKVLAVTTTAAGGQVTWALDDDLAGATQLRAETSMPSREPFASDVQQVPRIWVRAMGANIVGAFLHDDGSVDADGTLAAGGPVTSMSMEDGPDHSHITWSEDLGNNVSRCHASDIRYAIPNPPLPTGSGEVVSDDCYNARTSSGPPAADTMIVVWQTRAHQIEAEHLASTGNIMHDMSLHGRAPKVRFDGTEFWIAWIDEGAAGDRLHLASFDLQGNVKDVEVTGWTPVGDEGFQLVRRGATVYLVVLSADTLNFLLTCA
jgi:hypothetical protein